MAGGLGGLLAREGRDGNVLPVCTGYTIPDESLDNEP